MSIPLFLMHVIDTPWHVIDSTIFRVILSIPVVALGVCIPFQMDQLLAKTVTVCYINRKTKDIRFEHLSIFSRPKIVDTNIKYLTPIRGRGRGNPNVFDSKNKREFVIDTDMFDDELLEQLGYMGDDPNEFE